MGGLFSNPPHPEYLMDTCWQFHEHMRFQFILFDASGFSVAQMNDSKRHLAALIGDVLIYIELPDGYPLVQPIVTLATKIPNHAMKQREITKIVEQKWEFNLFLVDLCVLLSKLLTKVSCVVSTVFFFLVFFVQSDSNSHVFCVLCFSGK